MRVSAGSDYALRALIELGRDGSGLPLSAEEISRRQGVPQNFLLAILADLKRAGIVTSHRGKAGGWRAAGDLADVTVADVIRAVDGPLVSVYDVRPEAVDYPDTAQSLQLVWIAARSGLREVLEAVTIHDLAQQSLPKRVLARTRDEDAWQPH